MTPVGIEALNLFGGTACLDVLDLCDHRGLDLPRFENLMMREKAVALPFEDPVTFAVNAAKPVVDALMPDEKARIEMVIVCSESGIDFGKSLSTWVHRYLELPSNARLFEIKQACYSGAAGLQMAANFVLSGTSPGAKVLVITTDISRFALADANAVQEWAYSEPTSGAGAAAILVSDTPHVLRLDVGAYGNHAFEVMDTCRPGPDTEAGDADLSLMAYLDCAAGAFADYARRVEGADFKTSFGHLCFHTPFGGMVKGAHRHLMRTHYKAKPADIAADFDMRLAPSLRFGQRVGNTAGGSVFFALAGTLAHAGISDPARIGLFSYGSGCCSEFFSGVADGQSVDRVAAMGISGALDARYALSMDEYETLLAGASVVRFGTKDAQVARDTVPCAVNGVSGRLVLEGVSGYHRSYSWT